ncbi:MAG: sigma factor [Planctomycetota bacterium]
MEAYRNYLRFLGHDGVEGALRAKVDASDIVQEVLIRAQERFGQFEGSTEAELLAWLRTILAREIVDHARRHRGWERSPTARRVSMHRDGKPP